MIIKVNKIHVLPMMERNRIDIFKFTTVLVLNSMKKAACFLTKSNLNKGEGKLKRGLKKNLKKNVKKKKCKKKKKKFFYT